MSNKSIVGIIYFLKLHRISSFVWMGLQSPFPKQYIFKYRVYNFFKKSFAIYRNWIVNYSYLLNNILGKTVKKLLEPREILQIRKSFRFKKSSKGLTQFIKQAKGRFIHPTLYESNEQSLYYLIAWGPGGREQIKLS